MDNSGYRPSWFNRKKCFDSIVNDLDYQKDSLHILYDGEKIENSFTSFKNTHLECFQGGSDAHSYDYVLDYIKSNFKENDIVYIVEDDYLHRKGWLNALEEASELGFTEYWTVFDHPDKYDLNNITSCKLFKGKYNYWRTAVSTTNTVAFKMNTLLRDWDFHKKWCDKSAGMTWDHIKFIELKEYQGAEVSYPIPGYSTHCDSRTISPFVNWHKL